MLAIRGLHAGYATAPVLRGIDLQVGEGEIVALLGRNGAGRSTLLKAVMGLADATGTIEFRGRSLRGMPTFEIARRSIGYVPEGRDVFPTLTVAQNLLLGRKRAAMSRTSGAGARRWTEADVYGMFPALAARLHTPAGLLSGGEQQMLSLGRTLMGNPDLLLVDEPTEGLAPQLVDQVAASLLALRRTGIAILLVEQKLQVALHIADRCCVIGRGRIVFDGTPAALLSDPRVRAEWLQV